MTEAEIWRLVTDNEALLRREVRRHMAPHRRAAEFEDMYADVVLLRAHRIMRLFDPSRGVKPVTYLVKNLKWYAFEWCMGRKYKKRVPTESIDTKYGLNGSEPGADDRHAAAQEVRSTLARLPEDVRLVVEWFHVKGFTLDEVARHLGQRRAQVVETLNVGKFLVEFYHGHD
jgi:RNA polymerase sigma factor (sigma-70 family)